MSDQIDKILKQIEDLEATVNRQIKLAYETDPRTELTLVVLPQSFTLSDLASWCNEHGYSEIRYNARKRQFFGVRFIEDQPDKEPI